MTEVVQNQQSQQQIVFKGFLKGHNGWVTCLASSPSNPNLLVSGSRDKTLIIWDLTREQINYGVPKRLLKGHQHIVQDCVISLDGQYALSASWDKTLRLWDLNTGLTTRKFLSHKGDVLSCAFSSDNRQIVSCGRDKTIKLWNTLGECKFTISEGGHTNWISSVKISPNPKSPLFVSAGWDKVVKSWNLQNCKTYKNLVGHKGIINAVAISPDGSLCASGGKDGTAMLWDLSKGEHLYSLEAGSTINALCFSPSRYWLCIATQKTIKIYNLKTKTEIVELEPEVKKEKEKEKEKEKDDKKKKAPKAKAKPFCLSLAWSADGSTLFSGYSDSIIRVWSVMGK